MPDSGMTIRTRARLCLYWGRLLWLGLAVTPPLGACAPATGGREATADSVVFSREPAARSPKRLRVIGTNDLHGYLQSSMPSFAGGQEVGGAAALAAYVDRARTAFDGPTILLDGGDIMQGTPISNLTLGRSTVDFFNRLGYTAAAIGNHEFDWGVAVLQERIEQAEFQWLSANLFLKGTQTPPDWVEPTTLITLPGCAAGPQGCDSVRVGIVGISTIATPQAALPSHVAPFSFGDEATAIDRWVPTLRQAGADFVIVTIHEGAYCQIAPSTGCDGPIMRIAASLQHPPDLIVSGHSHTVLDVRANGVPIVQAGNYGTRFTVVDLERVTADSVAVIVREQPIVWVDSIQPDTAVSRMVADYEESLGPQLLEVITTLQTPLNRIGLEHSLGNLVADAQRAATGAAVAIINNGGLRTDLPAGPVRYEDLFRLQPFANTLVTMDLTGAQIVRAVENSLSGGRSGGHFSGIRVRYSPSAAVGQRVVQVMLEDGSIFDPNAMYRVTVNNFLAEGGDNYSVLLEGRVVQRTGIVDLDALVAYLRGALPLVLPAADRMISTDPAPGRDVPG
jgi:2',3'-cyclic-nucleotide 2'-phosphodiesterase (5'-nucleotidase family)